MSEKRELLNWKSGPFLVSGVGWTEHWVCPPSDPIKGVDCFHPTPYPLYQLWTSFMNGPSASKLCSHITMADYLTSNRDEVERFKTNAEDAFQWQHYFDFVGDLEPNTPVEDIMHRTRNAIKVCTWCQFGCGISKMVGSKKQSFWPKINTLKWNHFIL